MAITDNAFRWHCPCGGRAVRARLAHDRLLANQYVPGLAYVGDAGANLMAVVRLVLPVYHFRYVATACKSEIHNSFEGGSVY